MKRDFAIYARHDFGFIPGDVAAAADNDAAWARILADGGVSAGSRVHWEGGVFHFNSKMLLKKMLNMIAVGGGYGTQPTVFVFPDDTGGVASQSYNDTLRTSQGVQGHLNHIRFTTRSSYPTTVTSILVRRPSTAVALDAIRVPDHIPSLATQPHWGYAYKCTADGTTAAHVDGVGWKTANPETLFGGSPVVCTFTNGSPNIAATAHGLLVGDRCRLDTGGALPTNFAILTDYFVKTVADANTVTLSLTSGGAAIVAGSAGSGTHTVTKTIVADMTPFMDGTVEWTPIIAHGYESRGTGWTISDCDFTGFPGHGFNSNTDALGTAGLVMGNLVHVYRTLFGHNGGSGAFLKGGDSNACGFHSCNFEYNRGFGVYDAPSARNVFDQKCHFTYNEYGSFYTDSSDIKEPYIEGLSGPPSVLKGSARFRGGTPPTANFVNAAGFTGFYNDGFSAPVTFTALPASGVATGTLVTPSVANGQIYYVFASAGAGAKGAEPAAWPLGFVTLDTGTDLDRKDVVSGDLTFRPWGLDSTFNSNGDYEIDGNHNGSKRFGGLGASLKPYFRAGSNNNNNWAFTVESLLDNGILWHLFADASTKKYSLEDEASNRPIGWTVAGHALGAGVPAFPARVWLENSIAAASVPTPPSGKVIFVDGGVLKTKDSAGVVKTITEV